MEQSCSKIVSLHMDPCTLNCPNSAVCYHKRKVLQPKDWGTFPETTDFRSTLLNAGYIIHDSVFQLEDSHLLLLKQYETYNITIPFSLLTEELRQYQKQIQISVYSKEQAREVLDYQKLFLIKDNETFDYFKEEGLWNIPYSFMHFNINQDWLTKKYLGDIAYYILLSNAKGTTLDSCAYSWLVNGQCPYAHGNYIDITFDGTLRTCPFNRAGIPISSVFDGTYESLFRTKHQPEQCKYSEWLGDVNGESKHTSI